ncbi:MAG: hypothetical protein ACI4U9_05140 [Clostridia bacterium]
MDIRRHEEVRHRGDVQNLITSVILRQHTMFSKEDIYESVENNLERSDFGKDGARRKEIDVKMMVDDTLNTLSIIDCVRYDSKQHKYQLRGSFPAVNKR